MKFDKNGIRILDSGSNNMRKKCHPALHEWEETEHVDELANNADEPAVIRVAVCLICGEKDDDNE